MNNIQIRADVDRHDIKICRFTVDRPVHSGTATFASKEEAKTHGLAEKLFNIPGITRVEISDNVVTVTKESFDDWRVVGKRIGAAIRSFLQPPPDIPADQLLPPDVLRERVQRILDEQINPSIAAHGGFVELLDVENNNVYLRMGGGCQGCGAADITLRMGIERLLREEIPQIYQVLDVTDHAAGQNPYYSPAK
jgi:Fe-S cluster biogenesis protein NfuA